MENKQVPVVNNTKVSAEVFQSIASICASEIEGISGLSENFIEGMAKYLRTGSAQKGIQVAANQTENTAVIDISVILEQGKAIPTVAKALQESVKNMVEKMTNYQITAVNVTIAGVDWGTDETASAPAE